jgi:hypothetical protein
MVDVVFGSPHGFSIGTVRFRVALSRLSRLPVTYASNALRLDSATNEYHTVHVSTHSTHSNHIINTR